LILLKKIKKTESNVKKIKGNRGDVKGFFGQEAIFQFIDDSL